MRRDALLLEEMIEAAERAIAAGEGRSIADLEADRRSLDALLWNVTVLGEAARGVSPTVRERFVDVPWREPTRLRNRVVNGYWSIDVEIVHTTAQDHLPALVDQLRLVLAELTVMDGSGDTSRPTD